MSLSHVRDDINRLSKELMLEDERSRNDWRTLNFDKALGWLKALSRDGLSSVTSLQKDKCYMGIDCVGPAKNYDFLYKGGKPVLKGEWHYEKGSNHLNVHCLMHKSKDGLDWVLRCPNLSERQQIPCIIRLDYVREIPDKKNVPQKVHQKIVFFTTIRKKAGLVNMKQFIEKGSLLYLSITYVPVKLDDLIIKLKLLQELLPYRAVEAGVPGLCKVYEKRGYPARITVTLDGSRAHVAHVDTPAQNVPEDQQSVDGPPDDGPASFSPPPRVDISSAMSMASDAWDHGFDIQQRHEDSVVATPAAQRIAQEDALTMHLMGENEQLRNENKDLRNENSRLEKLVRDLQAQHRKGEPTSDGASQTPKRGIDGPSTSEKRQRLSVSATGEADAE